MESVNVKVDIDNAIRKLTSAQKTQVPYATAVALTRSAQYAKGKLVEEMKRAFDRPTPYTLNSTYVKPATKSKLVASVAIKDNERGTGFPPVKYLFPEVEGGKRNAKGFENLLRRAGIIPDGWYAVPGSGAPLDAYGNVPGSLIVQILSQLSASRESSANQQPAGRQKRARAGRAQYFAVSPNTPQASHIKPGIYQKQGLAKHAALRSIFVFTSKQPTYRQRYRFYEVAETAARTRFSIEFELSLRQAIATMR
jgi:hypothetical protein